MTRDPPEDRLPLTDPSPQSKWGLIVSELERYEDKEGDTTSTIIIDRWSIPITFLLTYTHLTYSRTVYDS